ncbi:hypothetical protein AB0H73_10135 [Streptomyces olivoreticuli]
MTDLPVVPAHDIARHLKSRLDAHQSARTGTTNWRIRVTGTWLTVLWTDTPTVEQAAQLVAPLTGHLWDETTQTSSPTSEPVTAPVKGRELTGMPGLDGITLTRTFDEYTLRDAARYWTEHQGRHPEGVTGTCPPVVTRWGHVAATAGSAKEQIRQIADHRVHTPWIL